MVNTRGVFRTQSNNYNGAILQKQWTVFRRWMFSQKSSIIDVRLGSKSASEYNIKFFS